MAMIDTARALAALKLIPPDLPYVKWFKALCAAKAAGLSFDVVDVWSSPASNYKGRQDVERTYRNIKPDGGITESTLFHMAYGDCQAGGKRKHKRRVPSPGNQRPCNATSTRTSQEIVADILANCEPASDSHPYIEKKLGLADDVLVYRGAEKIGGQNCHGALVLPISDLNGVIVSVQFITLQGKKINAKGIKWPVDACFIVGDTLAQADKVYVVEGIGQAWTAQQAMRAPAVVCFGKGRMEGVAKAIYAKYPKLRLIIVADAERPNASL